MPFVTLYYDSSYSQTQHWGLYKELTNIPGAIIHHTRALGSIQGLKCKVITITKKNTSLSGRTDAFFMTFCLMSISLWSL